MDCLEKTFSGDPDAWTRPVEPRVVPKPDKEVEVKTERRPGDKTHIQRV